MTSKEQNQLLNLNIINDYKTVMFHSLKSAMPLLSDDELMEAIEYSIMKRYQSTPAYINNNYEKHKEVSGTVLDVIEYIERMQPIITSSGVLFKQHKDCDNPLSRMISQFLIDRGIHKDEMYKYPKGHELYARYNLFQLLDKLNANACYGCLGTPTSIYYNIYICDSITRQGRSYISCSIMLFESLLANNVKFNSLDEIITFIFNVEMERFDRKFMDDVVLDRNITVAECFEKISNSIDMTIWIPTKKELNLLWERIASLSQEDINRLYYKNNLYSFCDLPMVSEVLITILEKLNMPFMDPNEPPKEIVDDLDLVVELISEYVYYKYPYIDKLDRIEYMQRDIVVISDTDSTIISFDAWYRFMLGKVYNIDLKIKKDLIDIVSYVMKDEFGDIEPTDICEIVEPHYDYDFYTDEVIETTKKQNIIKIVPQDGLKYSIINIMGYICSALIKDYLRRYCAIAGSHHDGDSCKIIMKNEFYFLRALITDAQKSYADLQALQEGHVIPEDQRMAIMGLPINKSTLSDKIKSDLQKILYEEVLNADQIDQIAILKRLIVIEKQIYEHINSGGLDYYKPDSIKPMSSYNKPPLQVNGVKAAVIYNALRSNDMPEINLEDSNAIIKIQINISKKNADIIKDRYPDIYQKMINLLDSKQFGNVIDIMALPIDTDVPEWILPFVDFVGIINSNLKNFPLNHVGLRNLGNDNINKSNIISIGK